MHVDKTIAPQSDVPGRGVRLSPLRLPGLRRERAGVRASRLSQAEIRDSVLGAQASEKSQDLLLLLFLRDLDKPQPDIATTPWGRQTRSAKSTRSRSRKFPSIQKLARNISADFTSAKFKEPNMDVSSRKREQRRPRYKREKRCASSSWEQDHIANKLGSRS